MSFSREECFNMCEAGWDFQYGRHDYGNPEIAAIYKAFSPAEAKEFRTLMILAHTLRMLRHEERISKAAREAWDKREKRNTRRRETYLRKKIDAGWTPPSPLSPEERDKRDKRNARRRHKERRKKWDVPTLRYANE